MAAHVCASTGGTPYGGFHLAKRCIYRESLALILRPTLPYR